MIRTPAPPATTEAIRRLAHGYALAVDEFELEALLGLWTADAEFDQTEIGGDCLQGTAAIKTFFEGDFEQRLASAHFITNHVINLLEPNEAQGSCYALIHADSVDGVSIRACASYTDRYRFEDDAWRFAARKMSLLMPVVSSQGTIRTIM